MSRDTQNTAVSRRALLMSSIGIGLAGCSSRSSTPTDTETETATSTETPTPTSTATPTVTPDDEMVPFSEVDRLDTFIEGVENGGTTVHGATRMAGGVSIQYERNLPAFDARNVAINWAIYYGDVTGYTLLSATGIDADGSRHGLFTLDEEQTQQFYDQLWEHWFGEILSSYEARWADE